MCRNPGSAQTDPQLGGGGSTSSLQSLGKAIGLLEIEIIGRTDIHTDVLTDQPTRLLEFHRVIWN